MSVHRELSLLTRSINAAVCHTKGEGCRTLPISVLTDHICDGIDKSRLAAGIDRSSITRLALHFARAFRHQGYELTLIEDSGRTTTCSDRADRILINLALLATIHAEFGQCAGFAAKAGDLHLLESERFVSIQHSSLFSCDQERNLFVKIHNLLTGPASFIFGDIVVDESMRPEQIETIKEGITKRMLRPIDIARANYRFAERFECRGRAFWVTELNVLESEPKDILFKAIMLLQRGIPTALPIAVINHLGRLFYISEEVPNSSTLSSVLCDPSVTDAKKRSVLINVGRFLRHAELRGISITDPNPGNIVVSSDGRLTLIDIAEIKIHYGQNGKTTLTPLLNGLSIEERGQVMQAYRAVLQ